MISSLDLVLTSTFCLLPKEWDCFLISLLGGEDLINCGREIGNGIISFIFVVCR